MTKIETAKYILSRNGHCESIIDCNSCPMAEYTTDGRHESVLGKTSSATDYIKAKRKWLENWLKENDK